jgi:chromate transporter
VIFDRSKVVLKSDDEKVKIIGPAQDRILNSNATVLHMAKPSLHRLCWIFVRVSGLTFGGGDPTMAALQSELVAGRGWLSSERYGLVYGLARLTPGTNILAFCAGAAWEIKGWPGAALAVAGATVPSACVVVVLTAGYESVTHNAQALAAIAGTLAAAVGMMAVSAWQLVLPHLRRRRALRALALTAGSLALSHVPGMSPVAVLGLAALVGYFWRAPERA